MKRNRHGIRLSAAALAAALLVSLGGCGTSIADEGHSTLSRFETDTTTTTTTAATTSATDETSESGDSATDSMSGDSASDDSTPDDSKPEVREDAVVHLVCAGDNLIHDNIYEDARTPDGGFDFSKCYEPCKGLIEGADLAILNQETLVNDAYPPSTYPAFSTPTELGDAVADFGFNVVSMCNNHVLDMGATGLISSLDYWKSKGILSYGAYRDAADADDIRIKEINGIKFAFLGYVEHTNGVPLENNAPVQVIYISELERIKEQIQRADKLADVVVVSCHYGTEIENELNDMQITLTPQLVEWGADLIIGTQSHALSTCGYIDKPDGGQAFVYYGLGNFLSTMNGSGRPLVGIFGSLDVKLDGKSGEITFENVKATPVISHFEGESFDSMWTNCRVYPLADYTDEMLEKHFLTSHDGVTREELEGYLEYIPKEFLEYK